MKGYRTLVFNLLMTGIVILKMWYPEMELPVESDIVEGLDSVETAIAFILVIGNLFLRAITNTPIFRK